MRKLLILLFACFLPIVTYTQHFKELEDSLSDLSEVFISMPDPKIRHEAFRSFESMMKSILNNNRSFEYPFDSLRSISILYPPDSSFRIFTTQIQIDRDQYRYFGALQWKDDNKRAVFFKDQSEKIQNPNSIILDPQNWYGALYYNLIPFGSEIEEKYLLFGYDSYSQLHNRKLIEILCIRNDSLSFGAPVFKWDNRLLTRFVLQYSSDVKVHLNFDSNHDMIIFDNLIPLMGSYPGQGIIMVPDGSYRGFKQENETWVEVDKIFFEILDEPPREFPILDEGSERDLFGRLRKG